MNELTYIAEILWFGQVIPKTRDVAREQLDHGLVDQTLINVFHPVYAELPSPTQLFSHLRLK